VRHYRVTLNEALAAHEIVLHQQGGAHGVRDRGAIESALARPFCGYYRSIESKAAALVHSLVLNHGFVDGNKRTAIQVLGIFLLNSGYGLRFSSENEANEDIEELVLAVAEHRMSFDDIASWMKQRVTRADRKSWIVIASKKAG
jgi:death-on-curing protein